MILNYKLLKPLLLGGLIAIAAGCKTGGYTGTGDELYSKALYDAAIKEYQKEYKKAKGESKAQVAYKIALSYYNNDKFSVAETWFQRAIDGGLEDPKALYWHARTLRALDRQEDAKQELIKYNEKVPNNERAMKELEAVNETLAEVAVGCSTYDVVTFRQANSAGDDYGPTLVKKQGMIFTSDRPDPKKKKSLYERTGRPSSDLYMIGRKRDRKKGDIFANEATLVEGDINNDYNQGAASADEKGTLLYYTDCNGLIDEKSKKMRPNCVIKVARRQGKGWGRGEVLNFCTDTVIFYGQPSISPDGTKLAFVMDDPAGLGNHDIYISNYERGSKQWGDPINAGPNINTKGRDMWPYWYDDTTLYFSSDGRRGYGGLDIYVAHGRGNEWSKPERLRMPLNSGADDYGIVFEENKVNGFLTSNRNGSRLSDIYQFTLRPQQYFVNGTVYLRKDGKEEVFTEGANVTFLDQSTPNAQPITVTAKADGKFRFQIPQNTDFNVSAAKTGYQPVLGASTFAGTTRGWLCSKDTEIRLVLEYSAEIVIPGILYDLDKATLRPESISKLDSVYNILTTYPFLVIELGSHTDCRASMKYNDSLSLARSQSCINYLIGRGIDSARLVPKGYGERKLLNNCGCEPNNVGPGAKCSEGEHAVNRRTTIAVLRTDYAPKKTVKEEEDDDYYDE